ncbi:hypothetical protein X777_11082 [Ooceraea biroi]|uniref:Uncharacterized protein n=1 Tax=Ooceraea biroi TaxID=2015173 RepID=A0A026W5D7_OOCBI|nr:hypothetical protein X777_11082 [Ooceraea biroi]
MGEKFCGVSHKFYPVSPVSRIDTRDIDGTFTAGRRVVLDDNGAELAFKLGL